MRKTRAVAAYDSRAASDALAYESNIVHDAAMLSVTKRPDGKSQVVYAGHPLYYYATDTKAGDTNGQGLEAFGAEWYVVSAGGGKVEKSGSNSSAQGGTRY